MERVGDGLYRTAEPPLPAGGGRIVQGALEGSNVRPVLELTTMLETVRAFEGAQRLLDTQHELDRATNDRVIRVGS
jgi:flagellar basal-body rod protein FlgF